MLQSYRGNPKYNIRDDFNNLPSKVLNRTFRLQWKCCFILYYHLVKNVQWLFYWSFGIIRSRRIVSLARIVFHVTMSTFAWIWWRCKFQFIWFCIITIDWNRYIFTMCKSHFLPSLWGRIMDRPPHLMMGKYSSGTHIYLHLLLRGQFHLEIDWTTDCD